MSYQLSDSQVGAAFAERPLNVDGKEYGFEVVGIGLLTVASGRVAASDPFVDPAPPAFTRAVPPGNYPVQLAIARLPDGDERVAFARLVFQADGHIERWEMAVVAGQEVAMLQEEGYFGYGVDAGTGCFMDVEAGRHLSSSMDIDPDYFEELLDMMDATYKHTRSWLVFTPSSASPCNIACFSSGWGDGLYPSFFGLDRDGQAVALVTDFLVF
ncbi:DUF4241 domain-containing protein [Methylomagnum ishizawai]|uniref:DUF4241 domain-containing protein n=1 Tax=Methylomagnum ishizawai TaxID=1760988 RepID=UPI001C33F0F2|nr:DUF4241 domain-containing protein [Methylomagnum ishizawai]BBL77010.1 hypothetical protein MishRS11D_41080 [Methylomagnum ishizawai]